MDTLKHADMNDAAEEIRDEVRDAHLRLAVAQSAMHATRLALSRWASGCTSEQMELAAALGPVRQARWYARAQRDFQSWLADGGFAQDEVELELIPMIALELAAAPACRDGGVPAPRWDGTKWEAACVD